MSENQNKTFTNGRRLTLFNMQVLIAGKPYACFIYFSFFFIWERGYNGETTAGDQVSLGLTAKVRVS